jgi:hypothetical protein
MQTGIRRRAIAACLLVAMAGLTLCSVVSGTAEASSKKIETLQILVTNDDGVGAPGINATVKALTALPDTKVTVVAPLTNQSGTGAKVTAGTLTVTTVVCPAASTAASGSGDVLSLAEERDRRHQGNERHSLRIARACRSDVSTDPWTCPNSVRRDLT